MKEGLKVLTGLANGSILGPPGVVPPRRGVVAHGTVDPTFGFCNLASDQRCGGVNTLRTLVLECTRCGVALQTKVGRHSAR